VNMIMKHKRSFYQAGLDPVLDNADAVKLIAAVRESCYKITLVFVGYAILEFNV
jgi:hypothetical protein